MSHMVEQPRSKVAWTFYLKLIFAVGILGFLALYAPWGGVIKEVRHADLTWFGIGMACSACAWLLFTLRWWLLMKVQAIRLTFRHTLSLTMIGQFFSAFLMGANGGDVMRVFYAIRATPTQKAKSTMTIVVDRLFGTVMMMIWIFSALPYEISRISGDPSLTHKLFLFKIFLLLFAVGAVFLLFAPFHRFPVWCQRVWIRVPKRDLIAALHADSRLYLKKWPLTLGALVCAAGVHCFNFTACYCLALGFGLQVSFSAIVLIMAFTMIAIGAPLSIGGHGIREATIIALFTLFHVVPDSREICVAYSLMFYLLFQFSWSAVGGVIYLFYHNQVKKEDGEAEIPLEAIK